MYEFYFEKMTVWKNARKLFHDIYLVTGDLPNNERYNITDQLKRATTSVSLNIAEGTSRGTKKDQLRFTNMAYGSLMEVLNLLIFSKDLNYISESDYFKIRQDIDVIAKQLNSLSKTQKSKIT